MYVTNALRTILVIRRSRLKDVRTVTEGATRERARALTENDRTETEEFTGQLRRGHCGPLSDPSLGLRHADRANVAGA